MIKKLLIILFLAFCCSCSVQELENELEFHKVVLTKKNEKLAVKI